MLIGFTSGSVHIHNHPFFFSYGCPSSVNCSFGLDGIHNSNYHLHSPHPPIKISCVSFKLHYPRGIILKYRNGRIWNIGESRAIWRSRKTAVRHLQLIIGFYTSKICRRSGALGSSVFWYPCEDNRLYSIWVTRDLEIVKSERLFFSHIFWKSWGSWLKPGETWPCIITDRLRARWKKNL